MRVLTSAAIASLLVACSSPKKPVETTLPASGSPSGSASGSASGRTPDAQEELEQQTRNVVLANLPRLRACYDEALIKTPDLAGRVTLVIDVGQNGKAAHVLEGRRDGLNDDVIHCLARILKTFSFHDGAARTVRIQIPFSFTKPAAP